MDGLNTGLTIKDTILIGVTVWTGFVLPVVGLCWKIRGWFVRLIKISEESAIITKKHSSYIEELFDASRMMDHRVTKLETWREREERISH